MEAESLKSRSTTPCPAGKLLLREELADRSAQLRTAGKRLVLTNGCFDLMHVGHVRYLARARALGDALAVGVNSDASVKRLKGQSRPIHSADDRAEILAAMACVDFVTIFGEDTATELVTAVRPSVYVKGGDYSADPSDDAFPVEGTAALAQGGRVEIVEYVPGRSTTETLRRALGDYR